MRLDSISDGDKQPTILTLATADAIRRVVADAGAGLALQPLTADRADGAVEIVENRRPRLIVVDLAVPGGQALRLCRQLRENVVQPGVPILALGTDADTEALGEILEAGATDFLSGPLSADILQLRLRHLLDGARDDERVPASVNVAAALTGRDALTGLVNRALFADRLELAVARAERLGCRVAVMHLDVDHFRIINDGLGRVVGDDLLRQVAARLSGCLRVTDTVARSDAPQRPTLARSGGDEFMLMVDALGGESDPAAVASRIVAELARPFTVSSAEVVVSASVGIAVYPDDGKSAEILLRRAETALLNARSGGGNAFAFYNEAMNCNAAIRLALAGRLRTAQQEGQFALLYQPVFDCKSRDVRSVEVLLRWNDPTRGAVSPDEFLPLAEQTGMTVALGEWVIGEACAQWRRWIEQGIGPVKISVNVSARQFRDPGFVASVERSLREHCVDSTYLTVEATEGVLMNTAPATPTILERLRHADVGIRVDEFGMGRTSLGALWRLPVEALKIDRSFIRDLPDDPHNCSLVAAIIAMAHKLRLSVVAVGVETEPQLRFLSALGCDQVQGFLLARPMDGAELDDLLRQRLDRRTNAAVLPFRQRSAS